MLNWWNGLTLVSQIFCTVAIPATVIMILQSLLLLFGIGTHTAGDFDHGTGFDVHDGGDIHDGGFDTDAGGPGAHVPGDTHIDGIDDHNGLSLISVRGIVAFFSIGGWTGVVCDSAELPLILSILISTMAGLLSLIGIAVLFKSALKLQESGNLNINNAIGVTGKVYIPIPPNGMGHGKITALIQEQYVEIDAINDGDEVIKTDMLVEIISVIDDQTVLVKTKNNKINGGISKWDRS